jgi:UDP-N-acetylmuramyl pentapeptide phosphotransferase/UDP-N-acetylglucosamine-1-phosphate transferase
MILFFICFLASLGINYLLIRLAKNGLSWAHDSRDGPQKAHQTATLRIGGLSIYLPMLLAALVGYSSELSLSDTAHLSLFMALAAAPLFVIGLAEDITKRIGVKTRLAFAFSAGVLAFYLTDAKITHLDLPMLDPLLTLGFVSLCFTAFAIAGVANAYNIIDGLNGLASMVAIIALVAIGIVAIWVQDVTLAYAALWMIGAVLGFFLWNYPKGLIFLGDGGAYTIGFWVATLSVLVVARNPSVSPWFAVLVNAYPIVETLFSIWRRKVHQGKNPGMPDAAHFHSLIYRHVIMWSKRNLGTQATNGHYFSNAKTSPYLWLLSSIGVIPALMWWDSTPILKVSSLAFALFYLFLYYRVTHKSKRVWFE